MSVKRKDRQRRRMSGSALSCPSWPQLRSRRGYCRFPRAAGLPATGTCAAGFGLDWSGNTAFRDVDCSSTAPAALYGCGTGDDGAPYRSVGDFGTVPAIELGLGYAAAPARFELLVEYRPHLSFKGRANFLAPGTREEVRANLSSVSGMLAGFVDLTGMGLAEAGPVRAVRRRRRRRRPYPDREDDHDLPRDDDDRAGRKPDGAGLDGDGRCSPWQ